MTPQRTAWLGLLPAFAYLVAGGVLGAGVGSPAAGAGPLAFTENPVRLIVYGAIYLTALVWLLRNAEAASRLIARLWPLGLLLVYAMASLLWSAVPVKVLIDTGHLAGAALVALAAVIAARGGPAAIAQLSAGAAAVVIGCSYAAIRVGLAGSIDADSGRWAGTTGNANTLGLFCAIAIGGAGYLLATSKSAKSAIVALLTMAVGAYVLYRCGSMTSLIVGAYWALATLWLLSGRHLWRAGPIGRAAVGALLVVLAIACIAAFVPQVLNPQRGLQALGRSADFTGRTELWAFGWSYFGREPLRGYGFDSLASILSSSNTAVGQLHNGYLDLLLRGGAIAGVMFVWLTARGLVHAFARASLATETAWFAVAMSAVLLHNWTESSILRPVHPLWLMFLLACIAVEIRSTDAYSELAQNDSSIDRTARPAALPNLLR